MQAKFCEIKKAVRQRGGQYWKVLKTWAARVCCFRVYFNWTRETHTHTYVHTYTVHVTMASTGRNPTPHHAFLHHESLYHNSGICQGADVLPAESRHHRVPTGWRKWYCQHMERKNSSCFQEINIHRQSCYNSNSSTNHHYLKMLILVRLVRGMMGNKLCSHN